jgi:hypothetical protein
MDERMASLVTERFQEWSKGPNPRQSLISVFEHIRDIPYSLAVPMTDPATAPEQVLELGKGSCGPKHYLLAEMYRRLGFDVVYATFSFLWDDPDLQYPPELRRLATGLPVSYHLACRVKIANRWVLVDATWDRPLNRVGFPVNKQWDGRSDTRCAVKPLRSAYRAGFYRTATAEPRQSDHKSEFQSLDGEKDHESAMERVRFCDKMTAKQTPDKIEQTHWFHREFEAWLARVRDKGEGETNRT